jgi:hypothetical protein
MARKPPIRTTKDVHLTMSRDAEEALRTHAQRLGYTESEYVAILVRGQAPIARPAADMQDVALAGNRIIRAIDAIAKPDEREAVRLLREAQHFIAAELRKAEPAYEAAVASQVSNDSWGDASP